MLGKRHPVIGYIEVARTYGEVARELDMRKEKFIARPSGFTLLELLISVTLMAVLVLILSMTVRTGLITYSRAKESNERIIAVSAVKGLLEAQLMALVRGSEPNLKGLSMFQGRENEISFVTTHVPLGSQAGGIFKVVYRLDDRDKDLIYAQKVITRSRDLKEDLPEEIDPKDREEKEDLLKEGWDLSVIHGVDSLDFRYQDEARHTSLEDWPSEWRQSSKVPVAVAMGLAFSKEDEEPVTTWQVFHTEPFIPIGVK